MTTLKQSQLYAALAAAGAFMHRGHALAQILEGVFGQPPNNIPRRHRSTNKFTPHQGAREIERRRARGW
ncbi:MAG TPA: hypothetical protein PKV98_13540 [Burkholderiaceae bacterium]|nr:hypothetical protein [Burkholderiaceae bacterium]